MTLRLAGSTSGYVEIDSQAVGGNNTMLLPTSNGSANQFLKNGSTAGTLGWSSMVEDSSGRVLIGTSSATANGGVLQVSNGVTFPATQSACSDANTLDDYEEGSFTPVVVGTTTAGTATYAVANGRYTKVGRIVHVQLYVDWSAGTGTGFLRIEGLPFTASSVAIYPAFAVGEVSNIAMNANCILSTRVQISTSTLPVIQLPAGGGGAASVAYDSAGYIVTAGSYIVD